MAKKTKSKKKATEVDPKEKERLDLLDKAVALRGEIEKENVLQSQFQGQLESLKQFWEIDKNLREERRQELREKEHRLQKRQKTSMLLTSKSTSARSSSCCVPIKMSYRRMRYSLYLIIKRNPKSISVR